jgi:hypothetical protein
MADRHNVIREGVVAGLIGATAVAVWFLVLNAAAGRELLYTPTVLGRGLFRVLGPWGAESPLVWAAAYTVFHYAAFIAVGIIVVLVVHQSERTPAILALLLIAFVVLEAGFYGLTAILADEAVLGDMAWYQIGLANLIAAALMGWYLWRRHPTLRQGFNQALSGNV